MYQLQPIDYFIAVCFDHLQLLSKESSNSRCLLISQVKYDATNFLEKNRDTLSPDIIHVLRSTGKGKM